MRRAHIAFINLPHRPHINPTLPVVRTLVRRGYDVSYVTEDRFESKVADLGALVVRCRRFVIPKFVEFTKSQLEDIENFYATRRPDLILYDSFSFAGRILAERLNVPAIQTSPAFAFDVESFEQQIKPPEYRITIGQFAASLEGELRETYGLKNGNYLFHREKLNIYFYPRAFQLKGKAFDGSCFYAGRCAGEQPYQGTWKCKETGGKPVILVSTSTAFVQGPEYFQMCIEAMRGLGYYVVLAIGDNNVRSSFRTLPDDFEILQGISQAQVLPHARLFVCLGGMISTVEAAYHGVPLIMMTHGYDEPEHYAENIAGLNLGLHLRKEETDVENLRTSIARIQRDRSIHESVRGMREVVVREPGAEETANRIEEYMRGSAPAQLLR